MIDIKNLILRSGGAKAEHPMKHYRCTIADLERFAVAIKREALLDAAAWFSSEGITTANFYATRQLERMAKELE